MSTTSNSIFQILLKVQPPGGRSVEEWSTAFCCNYQGVPVLATARHAFVVARLGPELPIAVRATGENWSLPPVPIQVIVHPVADICMLLASNGYGRNLVPLPCSTLLGLGPGEPLTVQGFLGSTRSMVVAPPLHTDSGTTTKPASVKTIGRHRLITIETNLREHPGLSGAPVRSNRTGEVIGIYSSGYGGGAVLMDVGQVAEL